MQRIRPLVLLVALSVVACTEAPSPSAGASSGASAGPTSSTEVSRPPASTPTPEPTATPEPSATPARELTFRALDLPAEYHRGTAEAVDGTTAAGWLQIGILDNRTPAIWDTTTGAIRVLPVPKEFVHPNGDTFVSLVGVSGTTAVGTGILGKGERGQARPMAWDTVSGDVRILDVPDGFTQAEVHAIDGTTAVGQAWTRQGEQGASVAWDTTTGSVRILTEAEGVACGDPLAVSGDTIVGIDCSGDEALPLVWSPISAEARDLDRLPSTADGIPRAIDGTTAVGNCCFGEEGTPRPLAWDTTSGAVRALALPAGFSYGTAVGVSGHIAVGRADFTALIWDLGTGDVRVLPAPAGYDQYGVRAISGQTIVGTACEPPPTSADDPRCLAAAWTLP